MSNKFPKDFLWGSATSAHQVEGGNHNDWSEWEKKNAERLAKDGGTFWQWGAWQKEKFPEMFEAGNYISGKAAEHYRRYKADFDIAQQLGHNAHRCSIEWSRIEPEEGVFSEEAITHYQQVVSSLKERNLEPFVTLYHWTLPVWVRDMGGWENKRTVAHFLQYTKKMIEVLGPEVKFWIPINEPTVYVGHSYIISVFPPQRKSYILANQVLRNLIKAHKGAYKLLHEKLGKDVMVGSSHNLHWHVPARPDNILDRIATPLLDYVRDRRSLKWSKNYQDFIGFNYYYRDVVKVVLWGGRYGVIDIVNPNEWVSDMGWDVAPEGIYRVLRYLKEYNVPIYITENGIADNDDDDRPRFIKEHLSWIKKAMDDGVDVRGYFYWSLLDNFEWDKGFWPRFGLVEVDYITMERKIRSSAWEYKKIIESGL